ncbi:dTMP kinase [Nesterenkonia halobia]|uniref:Thymidylate kinase n=1 Tax=Nesterenkonia halobia TaxID=37922 RepID=A0ABP6RC50_9MICC
MTGRERGVFIVVEGGDGAGKTTQLDLLQAWLEERGVPVDRTREPGGTVVGEELRQLVLEHGRGEIDPRTEALIFAASRSAHVTQRIVPALEAGTVVLCDRYIDSSVAYQGVGRELGVEEISTLNEWATAGLQPDLTLLLDVDADVSRARRSVRDADGGDRIEASSDDFHTRLRAAFLARAEAEPQRYAVLDAAVDPEALHHSVREHVAALLATSEDAA